MLAELEQSHEVEIVRIGEPPEGSYTRTRRLRYDNHGIDADISESSVDVVWHPANIGSPLARSTTPQVLTIHDLIHRRLGKLASQTPIFARDALLRASIRRASAVTAVSETTKADLIDIFGLSAEDVTVIGEGVDVERPPDDSPLAPWPYLIYPAMLSAHKNHALLLDALRLLHMRGQMVGLIFTGKTTDHEAVLREKVSELGLEDWVDYRGFVSRCDLLRLISSAVALVYPSLYEGFGLPVVEAMALGVPTVISEAPALVETAGGASVVAMSRDPRAWANAVVEIRTDGGHRDHLIRLGFSRSKEHSWSRAAEALVEVLVGAAKKEAR